VSCNPFRPCDSQRNASFNSFFEGRNQSVNPLHARTAASAAGDEIFFNCSVLNLPDPNSFDLIRALRLGNSAVVESVEYAT
jgi:hypothetical protein